ncbi:MAG: hypothetical protein JSV65_12225 [Armatimonadota bacterium]|nr:MAG: hypothetical protein JSV65_12225 [Armatimonadota bacterium]
MSLLDRLFGGKREEEGDPIERGRAVLAELRELAAEDPKRTLGLLRRQGKRMYDQFGLNGALHDLYRAAAFDLWAKAEPDAAVRELASCVEVSWGTWEDPTVGDVALVAQGAAEDVLYLSAPASRGSRDALAELAALRHLTLDREVAMVIVGAEDAFLRRQFVVEASANLNRRSEEVLQDFSDAASKAGLRTEFIVA